MSEGVEVSVVGFAELDAATAYDVWRLRQDVFVVEQACAYPDLDGRDPEPGTRHVVLRVGGAVRGYARVLDDAPTWRIGRVLLDRSVRGRGLADLLLDAALAEIGELDRARAEGAKGAEGAEGAARDVVLDAQTPLAGWYATAGFVPDGPEFLEDGIPHLPMRLSH